MAHEAFANAYTTTLNGAVNNSTTTVAVNDAPTGDLASTSRQWRLLVDSEIMLVTSVTGSTLTVTRGAEGTTAAAHSNAATATNLVTKAALEQMRTDICGEDVLANRPATDKAGNLYFNDDDVVVNRDTGAAWNAFGPLFKLTPPPSSGNWTSFNTPNALTDMNSGLQLLGKVDAASNLRGYYQAAPGTPYKIDWVMLFNMPMVSYHQAGFFWSDGTKYHTINILCDTDTISTTYAPYIFLESGKWTNITTFSADYTWAHGNARLGLGPFFLAPLLFVRCEDDGTNRKVSLSCDGQHFQQVQTIGRTDFLTPTRIGFFQNANSDATYTTSINLIHWKQS